MKKNLEEKDIIEKYKKIIKRQTYGEKEIIDGVISRDLKHFVTEDGLFCELARLKKERILEGFEDFSIQQINYTEVLPGVIKAWHLHFTQDDLWFVSPSSYLMVGLLDLRKDSKTQGKVQRLVLGVGRSQLLFIPRGVAHGYENLTNDKAIVIYFVNKKFNSQEPDEFRLPYDILGKDFWSIKAD